MYSKQAELPHLPIPTLKDTVNRFLPTALPLAENEEEQKHLIQACEKFPQEAKILQERLIEYKEQECQNASWLQHRWQTEGYLQVRNPLMQVSYFLFVPDDTTLPSNDKCIKRAAALLTSMAESRKLICSGNMPCEVAGVQPLCSTGFKYLFHSTRIPQPDQDKYHMYDPSEYKHVIVACNGEFFKMDFVDEIGTALPLSVLEQRLQTCVALATSSEQQNPQMGWLASMNRDSWTDAREELLDVGGTTMKEALETLESGAFVLCLDTDSEPATMTDAANVFWKESGNRWADKSLQLVCTANGKVGYIGEHSRLDAAPVIPLLKRIIKTTYKRLLKKQQEDCAMQSPVTDDGITNIFAECWSSSPALTETATKLTSMAKKKHQQLASAYDCQVLEFTGYGKKFIKRHGFICHDLVQQALQLASYRWFGKQVGTYEAALTRTFLHGRTETARPVSPQSKAFVESMGFKPHDGCYEEKLSLLQKAASVHDDYQNAACRGQGVDRHFFGLTGLLKDEDIMVPSLFSDPLYLRSKDWKLSTSSVIFTPGFGPSTDDGIAIGYRVEADSCTFTCTSRSENEAVKPFCKLLDEALTEIGNLLQQADECGQKF